MVTVTLPGWTCYAHYDRGRPGVSRRCWTCRLAAARASLRVESSKASGRPPLNGCAFALAQRSLLVRANTDYQVGKALIDRELDHPKAGVVHALGAEPGHHGVSCGRSRHGWDTPAPETSTPTATWGRTPPTTRGRP